MSHITVNEILDYASCPLRVKLRRENPEPITDTELHTKATKEGMYAFFHMKSLGRMQNYAISRAEMRFMEIWMGSKDKAIQSLSSAFTPEDQPMETRILSIYDRFTDCVAGVKFPISFTLSQSIIIEDTIDVVLVKNACGKICIRGIQFEDDSFLGNTRYMEMRAAIFRLSVQSYLGPKTQRRYSYEFRPLRGSDKVITPEHFYVPIIAEVVRNISRSIAQELWFPTTSKETCRACAFRYMCDLSLVRNK